MRVMVIVKATKDSEAGRMPSQEEQHQIMARRREQEIVVDAGTAWSAKVAASMPIARRHAGLGLVNG